MTEDTAYAATDSKGRVRAAMATELLDRHARGELRVALGRASDYYGPHGTVSALGESFFGAAVRGRTVNAVGSVQTPHSMAYLPDVAGGLLTLAERDTADGRAWHLPVAEPLTTRPEDLRRRTSAQDTPPAARSRPRVTRRRPGCGRRTARLRRGRR